MQLTPKLIPMDVAARVVDAPRNVPRLTDAPFAATGVLEKGIHVHWALPDAFTRATTGRDHPPRFRGVPDLWLVVRFNPLRGTARRTYRSWIVDSIAETVTPLADWTPPDSQSGAQIHTAPGVIKRVLRGWGEWDAAAPFDALTTAYYPECRRRMGFHDDLSDLGNVTTGRVSYAVVGWYSQIDFDPYYHEGFQRRDKVGHRDDLRVNGIVATRVSKALVQADLQWNATVERKPGPQIAAGERATLKAATRVQAASFKARASSVDSLVAAMPISAAVQQHAIVDALAPDVVKTYTVCHGSVMDVPLRETSLTGFSAIQSDKVFLYPNVQRAMAEVAVNTQQEQEKDWLDMMLGNLGQQSGSLAGVVDLAGAQHARTFQSVPGRSTWYARLEIHPKLLAAVQSFSLTDLTMGSSVMSSGHWPMLQARSSLVHVAKGKRAKPIPPSNLNEPPPAPPAGFSDDQIVAWIVELRAKFAAARQQAAAAGTPLDARLIRVQDHRRNAQPTPQGRSVDGSGPDQAGWWIDMGVDTAPIDIVNDPLHATLAELRRSVAGAKVHMPDAGNLFEVPGPRWYRPWAPHLVVFGARRSYRHGADGRFRADGHLLTRVAGEAMIGLRVGAAMVLGKDLVTSTAPFNAPGIPPVVGELIQEHLLADGQNGPVMSANARMQPSGANLRPSPAQMTAASRSLWLTRGKLLNADQQQTIGKVATIGRPSSPAGLQAWRDWYGPLFLDTEYTHRRKRFNDAWQLPPEHVETVDRVPEVLPDREQMITERQVATVSVVKVLKQTLVTELTIDPYGKPIPKKPAPNGVDAQTFDQMDVISAPLAHLDEALFAAGERERGGFVHMNKIRLFDTFGTPANWSSTSASLAPLPDWATALPARLDCWGRLNFRLQSAADPTADATPLTPPVCGILLPDFVDQSLEVYDATGQAIGQLTADDPIRDNPGAARTLAVAFTLLPWVASTLPPGADPTLAITNPTLRRFVQALIAQPLSVPAGALGWHETGFTAMLRVFDTVRSTLDPAVKPTDTRVRLLGEPILVMNTRLSFEASNQSAHDLKWNPQSLPEPPALPVLHVRVGDVTRPDDGVLGCFLMGATPAQDRFAPVSLEASAQAVLNQMIFKGGVMKIEPVTHPFIAGQVAEFDLPANAPFDTVLVADARGSLYATCGVLPRKTIIVPKDFVDPAVKRLEPTFSVGPLLGFDVQGTLVPVLPAPKIEGMEAEFVHDDDTAYPELPVPPVIPVAELPPKRVRLTEGWVRMFKPKL